MELKDPMIITSRLRPGVKVAGAEISLWMNDRGEDGKPNWAYAIDLPSGRDYSAADLNGYGEVDEMMATLLTFLDAAAEYKDFTERTGGNNHDANLFPKYVVDWAAEHRDELYLLRDELEN